MKLTGRLEVLTPSQVEEVHAASVKILENVGIYFNCQEALDIFRRHGAKVEGKTVYITGKMIEEALKLCPSIYDFRARESKHSMQHGIGQQNKLLVSACYGSPFVIEKGRKRLGTSDDYIKFTKLAQACSGVTFSGGILTDLSDIATSNKEIMMMYYALKYSSKLMLSFTGSKESIHHMFRLMEIAFDQGEELWNDYVAAVPICPTSPLKYEEVASQSLIEYARKGQPIYIVNCLMAGVSSPVSILGTAVQQNSELLAGLVLTQLVKPGNPVVYVPGSTTANLQRVCYANGSPEANFCNIIGLQLAYRYNIPNRVMSGITDSKVVDYQAGLETMQNHLLLVAAGAQCLHNGVGTMDSLVSMSVPKFVLDAECIERLNVMVNGVEFSQEELSVEEIMRVGPHGNHLMTDNTLDHIDIRWKPDISFCDPLQNWVEQGAQDAETRALAYAEKLLKEQPEEGIISPEIDKRMQKYLESI